MNPRVIWLNIFISAVIGIVCFLLVGLFPYSSTTYYQAPMGIIGRAYANSMLVLINSRMVLGSEETPTPSKVISALRFHTAPGNPEDNAIEADNADLAVDT